MLVGRESELRTIESMLERAAAGSPAVLLVRGEAGIGKTELLDEAARRAEGFEVLRATGVESEAELPYSAAHQLLRPLLSCAGELPAPQARALGTAFGQEEGRAPERLLVGLAILTLLATASERHPLLCLVDDAQWIDRESLDALAFAARRLQTERLAVVWAVRDDGAAVSLPGFEELRPGRLSPADATRLLAVRHGDGLAGSREEVLASAAGNPLALVELADAAAEGASGVTTVEQRYLHAVRRLPPETQSLLLLAAADGSADLTTVAAAADGLAVDVNALQPAELAGLVRVEAERVVFRHPLLRAAVYKGPRSRSAGAGTRRSPPRSTERPTPTGERGIARRRRSRRTRPSRRHSRSPPRGPSPAADTGPPRRRSSGRHACRPPSATGHVGSSGRRGQPAVQASERGRSSCSPASTTTPSKTSGPGWRPPGSTATWRCCTGRRATPSRSSATPPSPPSTSIGRRRSSCSRWLRSERD